MNYFFGRRVRIPTDIFFSVALRNKSEIFSISELKRKLSDMYELANKAVNTRQVKALAYHDQKVCNDVIKEYTEAYVYLPKDKTDKLSLK